jgi:hypothetical protein
MRERAEQAMHCAWREDRVCIGRDDVGRADQRLCIARPHREGRRVAGGEEIVELRQLAALALPPHPDPVGRVAAPPPVKEDERSVVGIAGIQTVHPGVQSGEDACVRRHRRLGRVREIAQQDEAQVRDGVGQPVRLDMAEKTVDLVSAAEDHRDRNGRTYAFGQTRLEVQLGKRVRRQDQGDEPVGQRDREDACRDERQEDSTGVGSRSGPRVPQDAHRQQERRQAEQDEHPEVGVTRPRPDPPLGTRCEGGPVAKRDLQFGPAGPDQPVADMAAPRSSG